MKNDRAIPNPAIEKRKLKYFKMKKIKIEGKLDLEKMTIAQLNESHLQSIAGGGFLSIGQCNNTSKSGCNTSKLTRGLFCNKS